MSFHKIDNPGRGHCGFYAFAIGLLYLIAQEQESQPLYHQWIALDPTIQVHLDGFLAAYRAKPTEIPSATKQALIANISSITNNAILRNMMLERAFTYHGLAPLYTTKVKDALNAVNADISTVINALLSSPALRFVAVHQEFIGPQLEIFKNSIKTILRETMQTELAQLVKPGFSDKKIIDKFTLYQDFGDLVENFDQKKLPHNFLANPEHHETPVSVLLKTEATRIHRRSVGSEPKPLEAQQRYVLMREAFREYHDAFLEQINYKYAPETSWWATDQDLIKLAAIFRCRISILEGLDKPSSHLRPTVYLHNKDKIHWTTLIDLDSVQPSPIPAVEPQSNPSSDKVIQIETNLLSKYEKLTGKDARYQALTREIIAHYQASPIREDAIQELKLRRDAHTFLLEQLSRQAKSESAVEQAFLQYKVDIYQGLLAEEEESNFSDFAAALKLVEEEVRTYEDETFYPALLEEIKLATPASPKLDFRPPMVDGFSYFRGPMPNYFQPLPAPKTSDAQAFLIAGAIGIVVPGLIINLPWVMPVLLASTGMTALSANLVFMLLGVYLASMITMLYKVYQESQAPSSDFNLLSY